MRKNIFKTLAIALFIAFSFGKVKADNDCTIMRTIPYLQMPTQNSMVVRWVTKLDCIGSVEYSTDSTKVANGTGTKMSSDEEKLIHKFTLAGLTSGKKYYYRVCSEIAPCNSQSSGNSYCSDVFSFTTLDSVNKNFKILIFDDLYPNHYKLTSGKALFDVFEKEISLILDTAKYDLVVFNGNCFDSFEKEGEIIYWLDRFSRFAKSNYVPSVFIAGECEYKGPLADEEHQYAGMILKKYIEFVSNGKSYGDIILGNTQLLFLDAGQNNTNYREQQNNYINSLISNSPTRKRVLIHHIPFFNGGNNELFSYNDFEALNNPSANIAVVINGHTHIQQTFGNNKSLSYLYEPYSNTKEIYDFPGEYQTMSAQGMAIYGKVAFLLNDSGYCRTYDLQTEQLISEFKLASYNSNPRNHANCAFFGIEFPEGNEKYPALYVSECAGNYRCFVENIDESGPQLIQTLRYTEPVADWIIDRDSMHIYTIAGVSEEIDPTGTKKYKITKFLPPSLPPLGNNNIVLTKKDQFEVAFPNLLQGGTIHGNYLYLPVGSGKWANNNEAQKDRIRAIIVINLNAKRIEKTIHIGELVPDEPEDVDFYKLYCGQDGGLHRISEDEKEEQMTITILSKNGENFSLNCYTMLGK
jgi:hypothetical protein